MCSLPLLFRLQVRNVFVLKDVKVFVVLLPLLLLASLPISMPMLIRIHIRILVLSVTLLKCLIFFG